MSFDSAWPEDWKESFDAVISVDSLVHSENKSHVMQQISRVLKPRAVFSISDVLSAENASIDQQNAMTRAVAGCHFARPSEYINAIVGAGLSLSSFVDLTGHLLPTYTAMVNQIDCQYDELLQAGLTRDFLKKYRASLDERTGQILTGNYGVAWGAFAGKKPDALTKEKASLLLALGKMFQ
eukprot:gnl/TRDRNA2_/TRDRNA2_127305_c0_seq2.p1 gnl/TRDRNA2_/TRDRNA2_127305_c0~~gnl/TRDRNA2_/TRDRNA2_127305_c0_seq2.p1  ORF type:complete len:181 (-),score=11.78 gnl/TRDRNA2_/TRDRNA2_127305_c0_seq2:66-608(-)